MKLMGIILAGGSGTRIKSEIPKQFLEVGGKPIIIHTLEKMEQCPEIDKYIVVCNKDYIGLMETLTSKYGFSKVEKIIEGGKSGVESTYIGIKSTPGEYDAVLIHDANRPIIDNEIIHNCVSTYEKYGNAVAAIKCVELTYYSENGISSDRYINRDYVWKTHTPQIFKLKEVRQAYDEAFTNGNPGFMSTTELYDSIGKKIFFSESKSDNIKITFPEDIDLFDALLTAKNNGSGNKYKG